MIPTPPGWSRQHHAGSVLLFPQGGPSRGGIRYSELLYPIASFRQLLARYLADPIHKVERVGPIERLVTLEGEHAACVTIAAMLEGAPAQYDIGFVALDHCYSRISALSLVPDDFATSAAIVRELTRSDVHLAGDRPRRFEYDPPPGWQARARGLHADWYPLEFPRAHAVIEVLPALPSARVGMTSGLLGMFAAEETAAGWVDDWREDKATTSAQGLSGIERSYVGGFPHQPAAHRVLAVFEDDRYVYPIRIETADPVHEAAFRALVHTVRPIRRVEPAAGLAFNHWAT